ncbi:amino acid synthesis family protein [Paracoccus aminophilus]|uniref:amino acid synthesis family protein n=1 Tax=Paracoccus aminophilus TaxID=34003 RepID=UPI000415364A|nr:amino acid synthesis family protein [Paracoccus aminophilus]
MSLKIRKTIAHLEEVHRELDRPVEGRKLKAAVGIILTNEFAGRYVEDLSPLIAAGAEVGEALVTELAALLGERIAEVSAYGKGAIVGGRGELEHAAALIHPKFGAPVRKRLGRGPAIIPSTKKFGGPGSSITVPLTNCDDIWQFDEMDALEITCPDGPREDELFLVLAVGIGGRPLKRVKV